VDAGGDAVGDMAGGAIILILLLALPTVPTELLLGLAVAASLVAIYLVARLQQSYVRQLAENLRSGAVPIEESEALDATTARTISESRVTIDRAELMARLREIQAGGEGEARDEAASGESTESSGGSLEEFFDRVRALSSRDPERIRAALEAGRDDPRLLPHALRLLGRFDELDAVVAYLRGVVSGSVGVLIDALVDREGEVLIRRRVPAVIEAAGGWRALNGLCMALDDPDFDVRLESARAAACIVQRDPQLARESEEAFAWAERELAVDDRVWEQRGRRRHGSDHSAILDDGQLQAVNRSVEHVCTLLSLALGPEVMSSSLRALYGSDENLRGTGLEYLQTVLPERIRATLWPRIPSDTSTSRAARPSQDLADELLRSGKALRRARESR
jgi:hypothetical protein